MYPYHGRFCKAYRSQVVLYSRSLHLDEKKIARLFDRIRDRYPTARVVYPEERMIRLLEGDDPATQFRRTVECQSIELFSRSQNAPTLDAEDEFHLFVTEAALDITGLTFDAVECLGIELTLVYEKQAGDDYYPFEYGWKSAYGAANGLYLVPWVYECPEIYGHQPLFQTTEAHSGTDDVPGEDQEVQSLADAYFSVKSGLIESLEAAILNPDE